MKFQAFLSLVFLLGSSIAMAACKEPQTMKEWEFCSKLGKFKDPEPDFSHCNKPRTTREWEVCSRAGKFKEPTNNLSHCENPRTTDEWLNCSKAEKLNSGIGFRISKGNGAG